MKFSHGQAETALKADDFCCGQLSAFYISGSAPPPF
jgi:hypothetical protein